jgi:hypothetical protein
MSKKKPIGALFDDNNEEENDDNNISFGVNKKYAERYDNWRSKEELQKCKL